MNSETQIVFIHQGFSWYLPYALYQAKFVSPDAKIVLLGDQKFKNIFTEPLIKIESNEIEEFKRLYLPVSKMSTNPAKFELFCWLRWFYLLNYMRKYQVKSVLYLDSDALLFSSLKDIQNVYSNLTWNCALSIPKQDQNSFVWGAAGHVSYWTIESLEAFCDFSLNSFRESPYLEKYQAKWEWHRQNKILGGICDMTTLYLFWQENSDRIINLAKSYHQTVFDNSINTGNNYEVDQYVMEKGIKKIEFINQQPYFFNSQEPDQLERSHILHCQGIAKPYMRKFYTAKPFAGKSYADALFFLKQIKNSLQR